MSQVWGRCRWVLKDVSKEISLGIFRVCLASEVCSNLLKTIRDEVTIVQAEENEMELPSNITGDEKEPLKAKARRTQLSEPGDRSA